MISTDDKVQSLAQNRQAFIQGILAYYTTCLENRKKTFSRLMILITNNLFLRKQKLMSFWATQKPYTTTSVIKNRLNLSLMKTEQNQTHETSNKNDSSNKTVTLWISILFAVIILSLPFFNVEKTTLIIIISALGGSLAVIVPTLMSKKSCAK